MIDVHSHILPNIDDGARNVEISVKMLEISAQSGVSDIIATPHFKPRISNDINLFYQQRGESYGVLMQQISVRNELPRVHLGAEVTICVDMSKMEGLNRLCIAGTDYMLTELDMNSFGSWVFHTLFEIQAKQSVKPIIAHIDRYLPYFKGADIENLMNVGCPVQLNASALFDRAVKKDVIKLINKYPEQICLVGSDCHDTVKRSPDLKKFIAKADKLLGDGFIDYITACSKKLLSGKSIY